MGLSALSLSDLDRLTPYDIQTMYKRLELLNKEKQAAYNSKVKQ